MAISSALSSELIENWLTGRARVRDYVLTSQDGVHAAQRPSQDGSELWEYVVANAPESTLKAIADQIQEHPSRRLIVTTDLPDAPEAFDALSHRLEDITGLKTIGTGEKMLVTDMSEQDVEDPAIPEGYRAEVDRNDGWFKLRLVTTEDHPTGADHTAARGRVATVNQHAVFDQIWTSPNYRRQGLGALVMRYLGSLAHELSVVEEGLLISGTGGQKLYSYLGWTAIADVVVLAHPGISDEEITRTQTYQA